MAFDEIFTREPLTKKAGGEKAVGWPPWQWFARDDGSRGRTPRIVEERAPDGAEL
jgi:hypothetical protein